jgi:hypothetical protein
MSGTTSLAELPISSQTMDAPQNITMEMTENTKVQSTIQNAEQQRAQEDQTNIAQQKQMNQLVTGIQQASANGATQLPSRDIPMSQTQVSADEQVKPNFVPQPPADYIKEYETHQDVLKNNMEEKNKIDSVEALYEEIQTPLLIAILYFIFQLPFLQKYMYKILPSLFKKDGNYTLTGNILTCVLFGVVYYLLNKSMNYLSQV